MSFSSGARTDMVISMTLAELFLMLLFVVWYGYRPKYTDAELARMVDDVVKLEAARKELQADKKTIRDQATRLEWWRTRYPGDKDKEGSKQVAGGKGGQDLPPCNPRQNVLVEADVREGHTWVRVVVDDARVRKSLGGEVAYPPIRAWLTEPAAISTFVAAVRKYSNRNECRWHYRLYYETKADYFDGHELLNTVFYPAKASGTPPPW
jgi:hypothetical protein